MTDEWYHDDRRQPVDLDLVRRWLTVGAAAFAAVLATVVVVANTGTGACAAGVTDGKATFFSLGSALGHCSYPSESVDPFYAALAPSEYAGAGSCGGYLDLTGPKGKVRVQVVDSCPPCAAGHIDLSEAAFKELADPDLGVIKVSYVGVNDPPLPGPLSFRIKDDSSKEWFALLVTNHGNPLAKVEVSGEGGTWRSLQRAVDNHWEATNGVGGGPFRIRVTDVRGHVAEVGGIALKPGNQTTTSYMYAATPAPADPDPAEPTPSSADIPADTIPPAWRTVVTSDEGSSMPLPSLLALGNASYDPELPLPWPDAPSGSASGRPAARGRATAPSGDCH